MPKTGGTFVHGIFKKIIADYKKRHLIKWYFNRLGYRLKIDTPIYQKLVNVVYQEHPGESVTGQHGGVSFIPKKFAHLPVVSVKRDPIKKFISTYYYRWWERFPSLPVSKLNEIFPHYPEISIDEYYELAYNHTLKHFFGTDYRDDIGILSWQFIRMYATNPIYVYKNISEKNYSEFINTYFADIQFFEMDSLSTEFEHYIKTTQLSDYSSYFATEERIYPPGSNNKKRPERLSDELSGKLKAKEWILYKFFPEYSL